LIILIAAWIIYSVAQPSVNIQPQATTTTTSISGGSSAPDFTLPVIGPHGPTGQSAALSSFRGKVVLLEFMEPWCPHCQSMAPILAELHSSLANVTFVSVAGPWNGANQNDVANFQRQYGSDWVYLWDSSGTIMSMYGVNETPSFFIISRTGAVLASMQGDQDYTTLKNMLVQSMQS
jgi:thiol-disulfide isomerase/thioredoxin